MPTQRLIPPTLNLGRRFLAGLLALVLLGPLAAQDEASTTVLFLGDSLTAGFGLDPEDAYPALVGALLRSDGHEIRVINGGLSGETSAGGARRVRWVMRQRVDILVLALGANDGLRGLDPDQTRENLQAIIDTARELQPDVRILLAGMLAPPNMGTAYREAFDTIYPALAADNDLPRLPFLLEGVAGDPDLNQADGIHPNREGQKHIARLVAEALRPLL